MHASGGEKRENEVGEGLKANEVGPVWLEVCHGIIPGFQVIPRRHPSILFRINQLKFSENSEIYQNITMFSR
jgi:hypothetical protein